MKDQLFLYTTPFVIEARSSHTSDYILDIFSEDDREDEIRLHDLLMRFAVNHQLITRLEDNTFKPSAEENMGSWKYITLWTSFRSMTIKERYIVVLDSLASDNMQALNNLLDLHSRLGMMFNHTFLNTIVNRVITSTAMIPFQTDEGWDWKKIHTEAPFLWILILLQGIIRTTARPL